MVRVKLNYIGIYVILAISLLLIFIDYQESKKLIEEFLSNYGHEYPYLSILNDYRTSILDRFKYFAFGGSVIICILKIINNRKKESKTFE